MSALIQSSYMIYEATREDLWLQYAQKKIDKAIVQDQWSNAQEIAIEWADGVCDHLGVKKTEVWKLFKRSLVALWFGKLENKRFLPNWSTAEALQYAGHFAGRSVRFSLFPQNIACHAQSFRLSDNDRNNWKSILEKVDHSTAMEMFPEASTNDTICFRRHTTAFGEDVIYEAGKGQAMFVFEQERGQHPVVAFAKKGRDRTYRYTRSMPDSSCEAAIREIETKLENLIAAHDCALSMKCFGICRKLGFDYVSIEGYFDPSEPHKVLVVDLDLPFDFVFMASSLAKR